MQALFVQKSHARCFRSDAFLDDFYNHFLESSDEIHTKSPPAASLG